MARSECGYLRFQAFIALLTLSRFNVWTLPSKEGSKAEKKRPKVVVGGAEYVEKEGASPKPKFDTELRFLNSPKADNALKAADKALKTHRRKGIDPTMRSPKRMIEFLGELTALQSYGEKTYTPVTLVNGEQVKFFHVVRGEKVNQGAAVTILGPEGEVFSVPQPVLRVPHQRAVFSGPIDRQRSGEPIDLEGILSDTGYRGVQVYQLRRVCAHPSAAASWAPMEQQKARLDVHAYALCPGDNSKKLWKIEYWNHNVPLSPQCVTMHIRICAMMKMAHLSGT